MKSFLTMKNVIYLIAIILITIGIGVWNLPVASIIAGLLLGCFSIIQD